MRKALYTTKEAARTLGLQLHIIEAATPDQIGVWLEAVIAAGAEGARRHTRRDVWSHRGQIASFAAEHRLPATYPEREYVDDGELLAYGPNLPDNFRRAATYGDKILKGAKPGDLPIQEPVKFDFIAT